MTLQRPIFDLKKIKKIISWFSILTNFNRVLQTHDLYHIQKFNFDKSTFATCIENQRKSRKFRLWRLITFKLNTLYTSNFYWSYFYYSFINRESLNFSPLTVSEKKNRERQNVKRDNDAATRTNFASTGRYIDLRSIEGL